MQHYDLTIIGTGSGNSIPDPNVDPRYADMRIAICEQGVFGGTCLNVGCIPTKMFVYAAEVAHTVRHSAQYGVDAHIDKIRWPDIVARVFGRIDPIASGGEAYKRSLPNIDVYGSHTRFSGVSDGRYTLRTEDGAQFSSDQVVIAAGARAVIPPAITECGVRYYTSDNIMRIDELPEQNVEVREAPAAYSGRTASRFEGMQPFGSSYQTPGWQRAQARPWAAVGAAHLQVLLQPHFREGGGHVVVPVTQGRQRARQHVQLAVQELAERLAAGVVVDAVAVAEVHRHVEQVIDVALVAEAVLEHEVQHAGAIRIGIRPDVRAVAQVAVRLALGERRVGKQRGGDRLQRQRHAELLHHVRFAGVIQVDLHRAGAGHHVQAETADLGHVLAHDLVAALRHPRHLVAPPLGLEAHAQETQAKLVSDLAHLAQMAADFLAGLVDGLQRRAGQFQLARGFQRDRGTVATQRDGAAVLLVRRPAEADQPLQQRFDTTLAIERGRAQVIQPEAELLVLGADPPVFAWLFAGRQHLDQLAAVVDRCIGGTAGTGHGKGLRWGSAA